mgnify:CR=1 FL=1
MNEEIRKAIQHIISYCWQDEMNDYLEQDEEGQRNHVFCDMVLLDEWLNSPPVLTPEILAAAVEDDNPEAAERIRNSMC